MNTQEIDIFRQGRLGDPLGQELVVGPVAQSKYYTLPHGIGFDSLEVHTCYDNGESVEQYETGETLLEGSFFSLYGHTSGSGRECIGDFTTFEAACAVAEKLGGVA